MKTKNYVSAFVALASAIVLTTQVSGQTKVNEPAPIQNVQGNQVGEKADQAFTAIDYGYYNDDFSTERDQVLIAFPGQPKEITVEGLTGVGATDNEGMSFEIFANGVDKDFNFTDFGKYFVNDIESSHKNFHVLYVNHQPENDKAFLSIGWINEEDGSFNAVTLFHGSRHIFYVRATTPNSTDIEHNTSKANDFFNAVHITSNIVKPALGEEIHQIPGS
ncbi:MAG: hypothetical protein H0U49_02730 [Parachlamydiaceae bacterium]|nr:hypothetical protein [Parachlamydiaceae bacterium]